MFFKTIDFTSFYGLHIKFTGSESHSCETSKDWFSGIVRFYEKI